MHQPSKQSEAQFDIAELQTLLLVFKRTLGGLYRKETVSLNCSLSHLEIMQYMSAHASPTMKEIAVHLAVTPPSVTTLIDSMVEHKLVKRQNATGDRRSVRLILTPKAQKLHAALEKKKSALLASLLKKLTDEQKRQLASIIKTLITE